MSHEGGRGGGDADGRGNQHRSHGIGLHMPFSYEVQGRSPAWNSALNISEIELYCLGDWAGCLRFQQEAQKIHYPC